MTNEFIREDRYIVFKVSDVERYLTDKDRANIAMMRMEIDAGRDCANKPPFKGLIVEADWPEYDLVWDMIESRMTKGQNHPEDDSLIEDIKLRMDMADCGEDSDLEEAAFFAIILARIRRLEGEKKLLKEKLTAGTGE